MPDSLNSFEMWQLVLLIPTVAAALAGYFLGWLRWRFRHVEVAGEEWEDLVGARQEYLGDVREQRHKVAELEADRAELAGRIEAAEAKMGELYADTQGANDRLRVALGERDAYQREFETVVNDLERLSNDRDMMAGREDKVRELAVQHTKARRKIQAMAEEIDHLRNELRAADERAFDSTAKDALQAELARSQSSLRTASSTIAALSTELTELKHQTGPMTLEAQQSRSQLAAASNRLLEQENLLSDSGFRISQLETDLADAQHQAAHKAAVISSLEAELAGSAASAESLRVQLADAISNSADLAGAKNELESNSQRVRDLAVELAAEREKVIALQGQLAGSEAHADQLRKRLGLVDNVVDLRPARGVPAHTGPPRDPDWPTAT